MTLSTGAPSRSPFRSSGGGTSQGSAFALELVKAVLASPEAVGLLREALGANQPQDAQPLAYTVSSLAEATGLSPKAVRGAIRRGELPANRRGDESGPYLIEGEGAREWVRAGRRGDARQGTGSRRRRPSARGRRPMSAALNGLEEQT